MSQSDRKRDGIAVRLRDVRAVRINAVAWGKASKQPEWAKDDSGGVRLTSLDDHKVIVELTATFTPNLIAVKISMQGLYEVDQKSAALLPKDDESQAILSRIPDGYRAELAAQASADLFPFLRQAFLTTSIQLDLRSPILLSPVGEWDVLTTDLEPH